MAVSKLSSAPLVLIFDFDGVVADSETVSNQTLADYLTTIGHPTTLDEAMHLFMGKHHADTVNAVERYIGRPLPADYETTHREQVRMRMRSEVGPVAGVSAFLNAHSDIPKCVASSSSRAWLDHCVDKFGFRKHFGDNLFSATLVANGKPSPDIYLLAAREMSAQIQHAVVIEDSPTGVRAGVAAGMHVIGFTGGSHVRAGHANKLLGAGAHEIAESFEEAARIIVRRR